MEVKVGVDTHKGSLELAACDPIGSQIKAGMFANDLDGCNGALEWIQGFEGQVVIGIEGSGSYGANLARMLVERGYDVREVPAVLTHRERRKSPSKGKSDKVDALAIARVVARGEGLALPKLSDIYEELKLLVDERKSLVHAKTQLANRVHADFAVLRPGYHNQIPRITRRSHIATAKKQVTKDRSIRGLLVQRHLDDMERLLGRIAEVEKLIKTKVIESGTTLHKQYGLSFVLAATILGEVGDPSRIRSEGAFAMLNGTAPVDASSGKVKHRRLNRRGNRQINYAIHTVAVVRARKDEQTRAYLSKKRAEGKTPKDAMRSLKRHISNAIFRQMIKDLESKLAA